MKKLITSSLIILSLSGSGQPTEPNCSDSVITVEVTQRFAFWLGEYVRIENDRRNRRYADSLERYIGSGTRPDSVAGSIKMKAKMLTGAIEVLLSCPIGEVYDDYRSIILGEPNIAGWKNIMKQLDDKSKGNSTEKQVSAWAKTQLDTVLQRRAAVANERKKGVERWIKE